MDSIHGTGATPSGGAAQKKILQAQQPGGSMSAGDNFSAAGTPDPATVKQQKILRDMILSQNKDPMHMLWCADLGSPVVETPMSSPDGKTIYAACGDGRIHAVDTATGTEKWAVSSGAGSMWDANATLSHDGKYIFVTGQNGVLECFDASKGEKKWDISSSSSRRNYSRVVLHCGDRNECTSDGTTIFASLENRKVSALDVKTGKEKWDLTLDSDAYGKPVLSEDEKRVYLALGGTKFVIIDARTGKKRGEFRGGDPALASAAIDSSGKKAFVAGIGSFTACSMHKKETELWKFEQPSGIFSVTPVLNEKDSLVYALHHDLHLSSRIFGLDAGTGDLKWTYGANSEISSSPTLSRDGTTLYVGTKDGEFAAIDSLTGKKKWGFKTTTTASPSVSPDGKAIYIGGRDGRVYALSEDALEECLARKAAEGGGEVPSVILEDGFVIIGGVRLEVKAG